MNSSVLSSLSANTRTTKRNVALCKQHCTPETYEKVMKSLKKLNRCTATIVITILAILGASLIHFAIKSDSQVNTNQISYSTEKVGHLSENTVWYINNIKYEIDITQFGYSTGAYADGTDFRVYLDDNGNVIDLIPIIKGELTASDQMALCMVIGLFMMCFVPISWAIWVRKSKSKLNPGREWFLFLTWLQKRTPFEYCFTLPEETRPSPIQ
ncbi:MAG: hypothetical protein E7256_12840 [Lachnospiraceae bacterium]|nr:hypothetical protein [Lachnospiraceae bacterium]